MYPLPLFQSNPEPLYLCKTIGYWNRTVAAIDNNRK